MQERLYQPGSNPLSTAPVAKIIGLTGYARSGKDTTAAIINRLYGHNVLSFSDILREFLYAQDLYLPGMALNPEIRLNRAVDELGWEEARERFPYIRHLQQKTGTEAARNILGQDVWVSAWMKRVHEDGGPWVNPSVRFPNEALAIEAAGGRIFRILRPGVGAVNAHPSDSALDGHGFETIINDGSLDDLEKDVRMVLES